MAQFGDGSKWLKGKRVDADHYEYVNINQVSSIYQFNTDDYMIDISGVRFVLQGCVEKANVLKSFNEC